MDGALLSELAAAADQMPNPSYVAGLERHKQIGIQTLGRGYDRLIAKCKRTSSR